MPSIAFDAVPADVRFPVVRGDSEVMPMQFFTTFINVGNAGNVELDITDRTYESSVAESRGGTVVLHPTVTVNDPLTGELSVSLTSSQTEMLADSTYVWDLVEYIGTSAEATLMCGRMTVAGRATAIGPTVDDGGGGGDVILDGGGP